MKNKQKVLVISPHADDAEVSMGGTIKKLADKYKLKIIEDCTESLGAKYYGKISGSVSNVSCFSFNGNKLITTGGGGMVVTNDQKIAEHAKHLTTQAKSPGIEYIYDQIGYNYRLTNLQAAMGVAQIENIDQFINSKIKTAENTIPPYKISPASPLWQKHLGPKAFGGCIQF